MTLETLAHKPWHKTWWGFLLLFCLWPFSLTYWIWKRNWQSKTRIFLITFLWIFLISIMASNRSFQKGYQAQKEKQINSSLTNYASENIIPTATLQPTLEILPSPTESQSKATITIKPTVKIIPSPTTKSLPTATTAWFDETIGNSAKTASFAQELLDLIEKLAPSGQFQVYVEEAPSSLFVTIQYDAVLWAETPESLQKDVVASFVMAARNKFPENLPHVKIKTGYRVAAEGEFSIWSGEPKVTIK